MSDRDTAGSGLNASAMLILVASACLVVATCSANGADADMCGSLTTLETKLRADYGETQLWTGKSGKTGITVRLYVSPEKGTWTAATVSGDRACIVDIGDGARIGESMPDGDPS